MKKIVLSILSLSVVLASPARAEITSFTDMGPFSVACVQKIVSAVERADRASAYPAIGEDATLRVDEVTGKGSLKTASVTVDEADLHAGYSVWTVVVRGTNDSCRVVRVTFEDAAH